MPAAGPTVCSTSSHDSSVFILPPFREPFENSRRRPGPPGSCHHQDAGRVEFASFRPVGASSIGASSPCLMLSKSVSREICPRPARAMLESPPAIEARFMKAKPKIIWRLESAITYRNSGCDATSGIGRRLHYPSTQESQQASARASTAMSRRPRSNDETISSALAWKAGQEIVCVPSLASPPSAGGLRGHIAKYHWRRLGRVRWPHGYLAGAPLPPPRVRAADIRRPAT